MLRLDDSIFEYALYDVFNALEAEGGKPVELAALRGEWRTTGLRHTDLYVALDLLTTAESLVPSGPQAWALTAEGALRAHDIARVATPTMADQVARSVLKVIRERVPAAGRVQRGAGGRRGAPPRVRVRTSARLGGIRG
ncbi:MAG: hypothetical protein C0434_02925 [Xanthomonadaceae bacterium]|nr:hypothetical protein [Xanthomonadaceae bacterium]